MDAEKNRSRARAWAKANPERARKKTRDWRARQDPDKLRAQHRERQRKWQGLPEPTRPCPPLCECCGGPPGKSALHLDHDHTTGRFRGWLCAKCNLGLGKLGDSMLGIVRAAVYLLRAEAQ